MRHRCTRFRGERPAYRTALTMVAFAGVLGVSALAFKPTAEFGHVGIVTDAIAPITRTSSSGETLRFSPRAILQIRDATAGVDEIFSSRGEFSLPLAHCDDELLPDCSQRLITIKTAVVNLIKDEATRDGEEARAQLGRALHTLQDFYSHSNWVNNPGPNNGSFNSALGVSVLAALPATSATCVDDFFDGTLTGFGLTSLTTGYFGGIEPPANKCAHGVLPGAGIHKDAPGRAFFVEARARAVEGTRDFINQILNAPGVAGNDDAIRAIMDIRGTLGFVIDDTGSMGSTIAGVKVAVGQIVTSVQDPKKRPDNYLLETFNDPSIGTPFITTDASALLAAVNAIVVNAGGDCPELSQSGLLAAIAAARSGSKLYLFSDASAKDAGLAGNVTAAANAKKIIINYVLTGTCSPVDPAYISGAQNTGGQLFFIGRTETDKIFGLIEPSLTGDLQPMMLVNDTLASATPTFAVPVDSTLTSVTFSVSLDLLSSVRVIRPSGAEVLPTDPDATVTTLSTGRIVTVRTPAAGAWQLLVAGSGDLSVSVMGNSALEFSDFGFVEQRGRADHEGLFPINGQPVLGETQIARARMAGAFSAARFELISSDGVTLKTIDLAAGNLDAAADEFVGAVDLPAEPFRVTVRGTDDAGFDFVRTFPPTLQAQSIKVQALADGVRLEPGTTTPVQFEVTNLGPAATILVTAADDAGFVSAVAPSTLNVGANATAITTVSLTVPAGDPRLFDTLTVVARNAANPAINNSTRVGLEIGAPDRTPPVIAGFRAPGPNANGWNNTNVTVTFTCADTGDGASGIAINTVAGATLTGESAGQSVTNTGECTDVAGNTADAVTVGDINIDKTAPVVTVPGNITVPGAPDAVVTFVVTATDALDPAVAATCTPASGSTFSPGTTTVTCTSTDRAGNTGTASFTVTVTADEAPDGRMFGDGFIADQNRHHHFTFRVTQAHDRDWGRLEYWVNDPRRCFDDDDGEHRHSRWGEDDRDYRRDYHSPTSRFEATAITTVTFSDDPAFRPGHRKDGHRPTVDTVRFSGIGKWNNRKGYTFEAVATDRGEPGRRRDTFSLVVRDSRGRIVAEVNDQLDGGNIQSTRLGR